MLRILTVPFWTSCRVAFSLMGFLGFINLYTLRNSMSVAIVCMVNHTAVKALGDNGNGTVVVNIKGDEHCSGLNHTTLEKEVII
jgi:hypothetical protein